MKYLSFHNFFFCLKILTFYWKWQGHRVTHTLCWILMTFKFPTFWLSTFGILLHGYGHYYIHVPIGRQEKISRILGYILICSWVHTQLFFLSFFFFLEGGIMIGTLSIYLEHWALPNRSTSWGGGRGIYKPPPT